MKYKRPTYTSLILELLVRTDDFMTASQIQHALMMDSGHVSTSLHMLKKYSAVNCMAAEDNLWWYATPQDDTRTKKIDERTPEKRPRRSKRSRPKRVQVYCPECNADYGDRMGLAGEHCEVQYCKGIIRANVPSVS